MDHVGGSPKYRPTKILTSTHWKKVNTAYRNGVFTNKAIHFEATKSFSEDLFRKVSDTLKSNPKTTTLIECGKKYQETLNQMSKIKTEPPPDLAALKLEFGETRSQFQIARKEFLELAEVQALIQTKTLRNMLVKPFNVKSAAPEFITKIFETLLITSVYAQFSESKSILEEYRGSPIESVKTNSMHFVSMPKDIETKETKDESESMGAIPEFKFHQLFETADVYFQGTSAYNYCILGDYSTVQDLSIELQNSLTKDLHDTTTHSLMAEQYRAALSHSAKTTRLNREMWTPELNDIFTFGVLMNSKPILISPPKDMTFSKETIEALQSDNPLELLNLNTEKSPELFRTNGTHFLDKFDQPCSEPDGLSALGEPPQAKVFFTEMLMCREQEYKFKTTTSPTGKTIYYFIPKEYPEDHFPF